MILTEVLLNNYLPYAKGVIIGRAIPSIDGLKPVQRRILYAMYLMGLLEGGKVKSSKIVGNTMTYHPHGDAAIYETMVRMSIGNESLNVPFIDSKGNFGKVYSKELAYAAPRYTEAKLAPICKALFGDIKNGAVDFISNFDNTEIEPTLLPVAFPNILVNPSSGIAVSTSSNIPHFGLVNVCKSTRKRIKGEINGPAELAKYIGVPEFTTGGILHTTEEGLEKLMATGKGSFKVSGTAITYPNYIEITEIPYRVSAETIINEITELVKAGELREVSSAIDNIGLEGFKIIINIKRGYNSAEVLEKLYRNTSLRSTISFNTRVILDDRCEELGVLELMDKWIEFRLQTLNRIYKFKKEKAEGKEYLLVAWEKVASDIEDVANIVVGNKQDEAIRIIGSKYGLDDVQVKNLIDNKISALTKDNVEKKLKELENLRGDIREYKEIIANDILKKNIICSELEEIEKKYGTEKRTQMGDEIIEVKNSDLKPKIDDSEVEVILTKNGYIKRLITERDNKALKLDGDQEIRRWKIKNNEHILVFTYGGECHKILVDSIDASRGNCKDKISNMLNLPDERQILLIDVAGDYSGYFNLVYPNGRGVRVLYDRVSGNRSKYKSLFEPSEVGRVWITKSDKFFMVTHRRKAAYCDLTFLSQLSNRIAFKVARVGSNDDVFGLLPEECVPDMSKINLERYMKDYCVSIGKDELWEPKGKKVEEKKETEDEEETTDSYSLL